MPIREEARQKQLAEIEAWRLEQKVKTDALIAEIEAKRATKAAPIATSKPRTFEVDGEQIPYEKPKPLKPDTSISNAWLAITKANR